MRRILLSVAALGLAVAPGARGQSLLYRSPNLGGDWVVRPGVVQFDLIHRFNVSPAPARAVTNFPTFTFATGVARRVDAGVQFATRSQIPGGSSTNESEVFARWRFAGGPEGSQGLAAAVTPAYDFKARSLDGELGAGYTRGPVTLLAAVRALGSPFGGRGVQPALAGGAVLRLNQYVALSGDYARMLGGDTTAAWSVALAVAIPGSPHTLALEMSNVASNTIQGSSRGLNLAGIRRLYGFEFTIPLHLARFAAWFHPRRGPARGAAGPAAAVVRVAGMRFPSDTTRVGVGQIVRWETLDPVDHGLTFDVEGPPSGPLLAKGSSAVEFDQAGVFPYHCTLHPFMKGVVVVR